MRHPSMAALCETPLGEYGMSRAKANRILPRERTSHSKHLHQYFTSLVTGSTSTSPCSEPMTTVACSARRQRHRGFPWAWMSLNSRLWSNFRFLMMKQCLKKSTNTLNEALISLRNRNSNSFITTNDTPVQAKWFREQRSQNNQKKKKM